MSCPPCTHDCRQGRDCPARARRASPTPVILGAIAIGWGLATALAMLTLGG